MLPEEVAEAGVVAAAEATAAPTSAVAGTAAAAAISAARTSAGCAAVGRILAACAAAGRGSPAADGTSVAVQRYPDRPGERLSAAIARLRSAIPQEILQAATPASDRTRFTTR